MGCKLHRTDLAKERQTIVGICKLEEETEMLLAMRLIEAQDAESSKRRLTVDEALAQIPDNVEQYVLTTGTIRWALVD
jgi:hypothetical protein